MVLRSHERQAILEKPHTEETAHAGVTAMRFTIAKKIYWPKVNAGIEAYVKSCAACAKNTQKPKGGEEVVQAKRPLEKISMDIITLCHGRYLLVAVDYYTRLIKAKVCNTKQTGKVTQMAVEIWKEMEVPSAFIIDEGCEFTLETFR